MDAKALRQKILDLAIRGKLVPQDPNDDPASVLLERIRAQKQQMVNEGKLKAKDIKNDTIIFKGEDNLHYEKFQDGSVKCIEDEIPFEIPQGWEWCRLGSIAMIKGGKRIPKGMGFADRKTNHAYIRVADMTNNSVNLSNLKYISDEVFAHIQNYTVEKNDLYITIAGTIGKVGEIPEALDGMSLTENAAKITSIQVSKSFLCLLLQADFAKKQFNYKTYQVAMPKLGLERIQSVLIPICGTKTQNKIVTSVREILNSIESIRINKAIIIDDIRLSKSRILDLAIRGKLVPQDPNDEPASVLLERIRAEKEELIKQGKIKRDKKESVIIRGEDNSYYEKIGEELPKGWAITKLEALLPYEQPTKYIVNSTNYKDTYQTPVLTAGKSFIIGYTNETNDIFFDLPVIIFDDFTTESKFVDFPFKVKSSAMKILHINTELVLPKYAFYLMQTIKIDHENHQRYWISNFSQIEVSIPSLDEQKRILERVELCLNLLDSIAE